MNRFQCSRSLKLLLFFLITGLASTASANQRIVGGEDVAPGSYPWMAAITEAQVSDTFDAFYCGGSVIDEMYVLTAAHCVIDFETEQPIDLEKQPTDVVLGTTQLGDGSGQRLRVAKVATHPDYDIALLKLTSKAAVKPVQLLMPGDNSADAGTTATVTGWGNTSEDGSASKKLQQVQLPIIPSAACRRAYPGAHDPVGELCAGLTHGRKDSCQGDSGGPLFVTGSDGRQLVQAGVVSYGEGCARPGFPGVYARVSAVVDWIEAVKANDGDAPGNNGGSGSGGGSSGGGGGTELSAKFRVSCEGLKCAFNAGPSTEGSEQITDYVWVLGKNAWRYGKRMSHQYRRAGNYTVTLYVIDEYGKIARKNRRFTVTKADDDGLVSQRWGGKLKQDGRIALPDREGISLGAGQLQVILAHAKGRDFDLDVQMRNETTGRWQSLRRSTAAGTREVIKIRPTRAGQYRFVVNAERGEGGFRVIARHP